MNKQITKINTTGLDLETLKPISEPKRYHDKKKKGFYIEAIGAELSFIYEYKFGKKPRAVLLGNYPSISLAKALERWEVAFKKVTDGKDIWLYEKESVASNSRATLPNSIPNKKIRILEENEIVRFWHRLDSINEISAITRLGLKLLLITGCSKDELFNATWKDINLEYGVWVAFDSAGDEREIQLSNLAVETFIEIQDFEHHTAYSNNKIKQALIDSQNKVINLSKKSLDRAIDNEGYKKLGIDEFTLTDLQLTFKFLLDKHGSIEKIGTLITELLKLRKN